jgi:hypothetical protein
LLASIALAIALVPLVFAYLQLGYHDDIGIVADDEPIEGAERTLHRGFQDATRNIATGYGWQARSSAVTTVRTRLEPMARAVNRSALDEGGAYRVTYNTTRAKQWADKNCPGGPDRQFGTCVADRGIVVQERAGRTHVIAAVFDIVVTEQTTAGEVRLVVARTGG